MPSETEGFEPDPTLFPELQVPGGEPERWYVPWYAQADDLIGGWCVMLSPAPPSAGGIVIAEFCREDTARHIAGLHNAWLTAPSADARLVAAAVTSLAAEFDTEDGYSPAGIEMSRGDRIRGVVARALAVEDLPGPKAVQHAVCDAAITRYRQRIADLEGELAMLRGRSREAGR